MTSAIDGRRRATAEQETECGADHGDHHDEAGDEQRAPAFVRTNQFMHVGGKP